MGLIAIRNCNSFPAVVNTYLVLSSMSHVGGVRDSPSVHVALVHEPGELPLGQHRVVEVEPGVLPDVGLAEAQRVDHPVELVVAVVVLGGPQGVGHPLKAVHDGAGEVVGRVHPGSGGLSYW